MFGQLRANESDKSTLLDSDIDIQTVVTKLKAGAEWAYYEEFISEEYKEQPRIVAEALRDTLDRLKPKSVLKAPGNRNTKMLAKLLNLSQTEWRLLDFVEVRSYDRFQQFLRSISGITLSDAYSFIAAAIGSPELEVRAALRVSAPLRAFGLIRVDNTPNDLEDFLRLDDTGSEFLTEVYGSAEEMLQAMLKPSQKPELEVKDFPYLDREFAWLLNYLKNVTGSRVKGSNILFYGPPGTGKSEFARILAREAGLNAFDVKSEDRDGDPISGKSRLSKFAVSQRFLSEREHSSVRRSPGYA